MFIPVFIIIIISSSSSTIPFTLVTLLTVLIWLAAGGFYNRWQKEESIDQCHYCQLWDVLLCPQYG